MVTFPDDVRLNFPTGTKGAQRQALISAMWKSCILSLALALYFLSISKSCGTNCDGDLSTTLIIIGHITAICGFGSILLAALYTNGIAILTPALGFIACCAIFSGFGNLSTILADQETRYYVMRENYYISYSELLRADFLTFIGAATVFAFMIAGFKLKFRKTNLRGAPLPVRTVALLLLSAGLILKYAVIIPSEWGYIDWIVPGTLMNLQSLADIGFMLLVMAIIKGDRSLMGIFLALWPLHFFLCILSFSKETMIVAALMPALGAYFGGVHLRKIVVIGLLIGGLFASTQNFFLAARKDVLAFSGTERQSPLEDRIVILGRALGLASDGYDIVVDGSALPPQLWWARLNYAGPQIRAVELFDAGEPLPLMFSPLQALIPRVFWPEKPELINVGLMFNRQVSGNNETLGRVAFTIFGEGYWMLGWPGVILFSAFTGLIFGVMSRQVVEWLYYKNFIFLPAILFATKMGAVGALGNFQTGIVIDAVLFFVLTIFSTFLAVILRRQA